MGAERSNVLRPTVRGGVREACLEEALAIIEESGVEALSLREVSRRLGVSHQAPYRHFTNRDDLLAELLSRCFEVFAAHLEARPRSDHPAMTSSRWARPISPSRRRIPRATG